MKVKLIYLIFVLICFETSTLMAQNFVWASVIGGPAAAAPQVVYNAIVTDASGNVYSTGYFQSTCDFDPGAGTYTMTSTSGNPDIFILKLDAAGNFLWAKQFGSTGSDFGYSISLDALGNVYTTGIFVLTVDFDPSASIFNLTSFGSNDAYVSKLDASGNFIWAMQLGGVNADDGISLAIDPLNNVYVAGEFVGTSDFDPSSSTFNMTSFGVYDVFITKLNASGGFIWAKQLGGAGNELPRNIKVDVSGNVYTIGDFVGTTDFDPSASVYNLTGAGTFDAFICKLDALGNFVFAKQLTGAGEERGKSICVDAVGNIYGAGYFNGTPDFDPSTSTYTLTSNGGYDIFINKLDVSGNFVWAKQMGSIGNDYGNSLMTDVNGNVYSTGTYTGVVDFDPSAASFTLASSCTFEMFIHKLDAAGNFIWAKAIASNTSTSGQSIYIDLPGNIYTNGSFQGTVDFDPSASVYTVTSASNRMFVLKLSCQAPNNPINNTSASFLNICPGNSTTLSATGTNTLSWYGSSTSTNVIGTGTTFITPTLSTGTYTYYIEASSACTVSLTRTTITVTVNALPTIVATTSNSLICGPPFQQTATVTANGANTYTWNPGGMGISITVSPSVTTIYTVTGTDGNGCVNSSVITQSVSTCAGINQIDTSSNELTIYPNPFHDKLMIAYGNGQQVKIFNVFGSIFYSGYIKSEKTEIDMANANSGIYFITIGASTKKIIKN